MEADAMTSLKTILRGIKKNLQKKERIREKSHKDLRRATSLSKQAILLIHQKKLAEIVKKGLVLKCQSNARTKSELYYNRRNNTKKVY
jgi:predicted translin family RNA/ssDNA-binding protein